MKKASDFYENTIIIVSICIFFVFSWLSLISTSTVTLMEHVYFTDISGSGGAVFLAVIICLSLFPGIRSFFKKEEDRLSKDTKLFRSLYITAYVILLVLCISWILLTGFDSWADSEQVQTAAYNLVHGDYSDFIPGGYIEKYPNQTGIVLLEALIISIFGRSVTVFGLINAICVSLIFAALSGFADLKLHKLIIMIFGMIWFPMIFTSSHIYGNVPGLCFALWAFVLLICCEKKGRSLYGVLSVFLIAFSCLIKQNFYIFLIAYILTGSFISLRKKKLSPAVISVCALILTVVFSKTSSAVLSGITGTGTDGGISPLSFVAMGLQEGDRAPGWFNEYNSESYLAAGYDSKLQSEAALYEIKSRLSEFKAHPAYALDFFVKKTASQWNEPSFQSIWVLRGHEKELPAFIERMVSISGSDRLIQYLKVFQVVIYILSLAMVLTCGDMDERYILLLTTFAGGVFFHLIWEAKAQYAIIYFVLLVPVALNGFMNISSKLHDLFSAKKKEQKKKSSADKGRRILIVTGLAVSLLLIGVICLKHIPEGLGNDTGEYRAYVTENSSY